MAEYALDYAPGVVSDDTVLTRGGRYVDADKVRFTQAGEGQPWRPQLIGGWERLVRTQLTGVCRTVFAWTDNGAQLNIAFGTHSRLMHWKGGALTDITPYGPPTRLGADPFAVTNASAVVTVTHTAHGYTDASPIKVFGSTAGGGITVVGGPFVITVVNADSYTFTFTSPASSTDATTGGADVVIIPQTVLPAGQIDGTGGAGYGTGGYGVGGYGQPSEDDYFPRTWSFGLLGEALIASPRDGPIFMWENDTAQRAAWLENSPLRNTAILTTPERIVVALGTEEEASPHTFNARCVRHSDPRDETVWNTDTDTLAREKVLEGAGRLIAGRQIDPGAFVWTDNEVYEMQYVGALDEVYSFTPRGAKCGLIGPNAATVSGSTAYWIGPQVAFFGCSLGGQPGHIDSPMIEELRGNLTPSQRDKIVVSTLAGFDEVWISYPDNRDGLENSRMMFFHRAAGWWSKALLARTAMCDAGPADAPVWIDISGNAFWHERGQSSDGNAISWSLSAGPQYIDSGHSAIFLRSFWPDFTDQTGAISLNITTREYPQSTPVAYGPFMLSSTDEKADLHIDGRIISWSISGAAGPASFRLGTPIVEGKATRRAR